MAAARRRFRAGFWVAGLVLVALVLWIAFGQKKKPPPAKPPTIPVAAAQVSVADVPVSVDALGSALAWQGVVIRAQVNGALKQVNFTEGSEVKAGQVLAQIDPAPYRAALLQAQGALVRDKALLANAKLDLTRYQTLAAQDSIAKQQADTQAALVKQDEGVVKIDEGAVAAAQINLNYCTIVSPVAGRVGVRLVDPGNLVSTTDTTGIVTVNQIQPIAVTFTVPEGDFQRLSAASGGFSQSLAVQAMSQETGAPLGEGELRIADNHVDASTGTVLLKARFENPGRQLWPGQFVNVRLRLQTIKQAVTIPSAAVNQGPKGAFAYVVGPDKKVAAQPISVTVNQGGVAVVASGLKAGQTVVTDGQMSLKPGSMVAIHPAAPSKKPAA
jgi:multidrug efflux system membrane fusion protein